MTEIVKPSVKADTNSNIKPDTNSDRYTGIKSGTKAGIDAGGTLIKIAYIDQNDELKLIKFPTRQMPAVSTWLQEHLPLADICITGGKGTLLQTYVQREFRSIVEFDATCSGVQYLIGQQGVALESFVLTNVGTGTSIHMVDPKTHFRIGGTGVGGGTIMGLGFLLTGLRDFHELVLQARQGDRNHVDLKVSHIYEGAVPPISGDLTASNFGNVLNHAWDYGDQCDDQPSEQQREQQHADRLASVIGLVGETVTTASILAAGQYDISTVVYIGSSFIGNEMLKEVVEQYTVLRGAKPVILKDGEYSGALGALLS